MLVNIASDQRHQLTQSEVYRSGLICVGRLHAVFTWRSIRLAAAGFPSAYGGALRVPLARAAEVGALRLAPCVAAALGLGPVATLRAAPGVGAPNVRADAGDSVPVGAFVPGCSLRRHKIGPFWNAVLREGLHQLDSLGPWLLEFGLLSCNSHSGCT